MFLKLLIARRVIGLFAVAGMVGGGAAATHEAVFSRPAPTGPSMATQAAPARDASAPSARASSPVPRGASGTTGSSSAPLPTAPTASGSSSGGQPAAVPGAGTPGTTAADSAASSPEMSASTPPPPASTPPPPASTAPSTTSQAPSAGTSPAPAQTGGPSTGTFTGLPVAPAGWQQVYADDFSVDASSAQVGRSYPRLTLYPDNSGGGKYQTELVDVSGGTLRMGVQGSGGQAQGSALTITNPTTQWGQTYGRYSIRFRADRASDSGAAMMLWPDSDVWSDGETDCVEGDFDGTIHSFNHRVGANPEQNSLAVDTGMSWQDWHVSTVEWTPTAIRFYLDGQLIGTDTSAVARASRHWVIQTAGTGSGSLQIDWVAMYQYTG